jgi:hypothetical protein
LKEPTSGPIREYTREPCPICDHKQWCGRREDGLVLCKRPPAPREVSGFVFRGMAADGTTGMYVEAGREFQNQRPRNNTPQSNSTAGTRSNDKKVSPKWLGENYPQLVEQCNPERLKALAEELRLPESALEVLEVGWWPDRRWWNPETRQEEGEPGCWTFPEYDAQGRMIGVGLRWPAGQKGQLAGGRRGLTLPRGWRELPDPCVVVEGPSDVLAGRAIGLNVIGRPSNSGGAELLAQICRDKRVIVLAENDRKSDGRWPGKEGAESVARKLESTWGRPVPVAFPPPDIKDLRAWVVDRAPDPVLANSAPLRATILNALLPSDLVWLTRPPDKRGRVVIRVFRWADGATATPIHADRLHPDQESARKRFTKALVKVEPQADYDQITQQLLGLISPAIESHPATVASTEQLQGPEHVNLSQVANPDGLPTVNLPGGPVPIQESAGRFGELLASTKRYLLRGGAVVTISVDEAGRPILEVVKPAALASVFETVAKLMEFVERQGRHEYREAVCSEQQAKLIQHCDAFKRALPPLRLLSSCPVLIERGGELVQISGYDRESGIMALAQPAAEVGLEDAVEMLNGVLSDFRFASPADLARGLAAMITPALVMGGLLGGRAPVDLGEADTSQSGKGYRNKITAAIYNDTVRAVTQKKGGVGSLEETFATALIRGRNFISLDNVRGQIDSPAIESFLTEDSFEARAPHQAAVEIDPRRVILQLTSNRAEITIDLANRSCCVRILRQPEGYRFREYPEGDVLDHIRANQTRYLGAIFAVIRAWHRAGKPKTSETRHDFRPWAQTLDWIVQNIIGAGPLLDGHRETQVRMATPALNWLRDVALAVRGANRLEEWLRASQLAEIIAESHAAELPGLPDGGDIDDEENRKKVLQAIGRRLGQCFRSESTRSIDGFQIERRELEDEHRRQIREYCFRTNENEPITCPYAPESHRGRIGADQAQNIVKSGTASPAELEEPADSATCPYQPVEIVLDTYGMINRVGMERFENSGTRAHHGTGQTEAGTAGSSCGDDESAAVAGSSVL